MRSRIALLGLGLAFGLGFAAPAAAQADADSSSTVSPDSLPSYIPRAPVPGHGIRWYQPMAVVGGIGLLSLLDQPIANHFRDHRSQGGQDLADAWSRVGTPLVYGPITVGVLAGGLIAHDKAVTGTGLRLAFSLAVAGASNQALKFALGRERPNQNVDAYDFDPLHVDRAFPSGHVTMAFAMAASLSDDIHRPWATLGLYGAATGVAVARVYQQAHWLSDVVGGAALGIISAKLVNGRWRIFGLRPPGFLVSPAGTTAVGWHASF